MTATTLCYIQDRDRYLMLHRVKKAHDINHDKWIGVGGKLEEGESPEDGVRREVMEETGLTLERCRFRALLTFISDQCPTEYICLFTADRFSGTLHSCDEGELAWVPMAKMESLSLWEGDAIFLKLLEERNTFFSLKLCYRGDHLTAAELDGQPLPLKELP